MQQEFRELAGEIRLARLTLNDSEEKLQQVPAQRAESWSSYFERPFQLVFAIFSSNAVTNDAERLQRMRAAGGDGSWRL